MATVGEEGLGDLRGVKQLFRDTLEIDRFVSIDGTGLGIFDPQGRPVIHKAPVIRKAPVTPTSTHAAGSAAARYRAEL